MATIKLYNVSCGFDVTKHANIVINYIDRCLSLKSGKFNDVEIDRNKYNSIHDKIDFDMLCKTHYQTDSVRAKLLKMGLAEIASGTYRVTEHLFFKQMLKSALKRHQRLSQILPEDGVCRLYDRLSFNFVFSIQNFRRQF